MRYIMSLFGCNNMSLKSILESTELILLVAIILPIIFSIDVGVFKSSVNILLSVIMFFSIRPFFSQKFDMRKDGKGVVTSILLNYVLLSGVYLLLASLFFPVSSDYFKGYILLAIIAPAVSIGPLCFLTKCDMKIADTAIFISYLLSLIIIPVASILIFGKGFDFMLLIQALILLIVIPFILAYFARNATWKIFDFSKVITNFLLGGIVLISISINRLVFLDVLNPVILKIFVINILAIFGLGLLVYFISRRFVPEMDAIAYSLYATQKNEGTGIVLALLLFSSQTVIPIIIALVLQFIYFMIFKRIILRNSQAADSF